MRTPVIALIAMCVGTLGLAACATPQSPVEALRPFYAAYEGPLPQRPEGAPALARETTLTRLAFGSCMEETKAAPILASIAASEPQAFLFIGDNVYGDADSADMSLPELRQAYADLATHPDFQTLNAAAPIIPIWDDHDYGMNDAGARFSAKEFAERIFLDFWRIPEDDPRRARPGVHTALTHGPEGQTVRLILLDTRFFRDDLKPGTDGRRYDPDPDPRKSMLGAAQWDWLAEELAQPADLIILVSSIQIIADGHSWEAWATLPAERARLYALTDTLGLENVVFISGDRHRGGIYKRTRPEGLAPQYEMTASSLNLPVSAWGGQEEPGPNRLGPTYLEENFGVIDIDWERGVVTLSLRDRDGAAVLSREAPFRGR